MREWGEREHLRTIKIEMASPSTLLLRTNGMGSAKEELPKLDYSFDFIKGKLMKGNLECLENDLLKILWKPRVKDHGIKGETI